MFNKYFGKEETYQDNKQYLPYKMLNTYENVFSNWNDNSYDAATIRACIHIIASSCGKLKPKHIRRNGKEITELNNDSLENLLAVRPNEYMNTYDFIYKTVSQLYLFNNAFIYIKTSNGGQVLGLYPVNYEQLELKEYGGELYCKFYFMQGKQITLPYSSLIHLRRHYCKNDIFGESNNVPLKNQLTILNTLEQGLLNLVKNSTKLRGILKFLNNISPDDLATQTKNFTEQYLNYKNGSGIASIDTKCDFQQLTADIQSADFNQMNFVRENVYRYFNINENIIQSKYTEDEWNAFYESIVEPIAIQLSLEFTSKLFTEKEKGHGNEVIFESNRLQYASANTKIAIIEKLMPLGLISTNEGREIFNLAPIEGGDVRQVSLNYVNADKQNKYQVGEDKDKEVKDED